MANSYDLSGKTALVTGGARGIGRAIAELLVASGAGVLVWDTNPVDFEGASSMAVDVTIPEQIARDSANHQSRLAHRHPGEQRRLSWSIASI